MRSFRVIVFLRHDLALRFAVFFFLLFKIFPENVFFSVSHADELYVFIRYACAVSARSVRVRSSVKISVSVVVLILFAGNITVAVAVVTGIFCVLRFVFCSFFCFAFLGFLGLQFFFPGFFRGCYAFFLFILFVRFFEAVNDSGHPFSEFAARRSDPFGQTDE